MSVTPGRMRKNVTGVIVEVDGVAWSADPTADPAALVAQADGAMYEAKRRRQPQFGARRRTPSA